MNQGSEIQLTFRQKLSERKEDKGLRWASWEGSKGESLLGQMTTCY